MAYVSITGLKLKHFWNAPTFWRHATRSMVQAQRAPGCQIAEARTIAGIHHTRSLWDSRTDMIRYLRAGAHKEALQAFSKIATGKVLGFETDTLPDWDEIHRLWNEEGRVV